MNKTQGVFTMLNLLKARGPCNTAELAKELQVTQRTICRYMKELRRAGFRFETKSGHRGFVLLIKGGDNLE